MRAWRPFRQEARPRFIRAYTRWLSHWRDEISSHYRRRNPAGEAPRNGASRDIAVRASGSDRTYVAAGVSKKPRAITLSGMAAPAHADVGAARRHQSCKARLAELYTLRATSTSAGGEFASTGMCFPAAIRSRAAAVAAASSILRQASTSVAIGGRSAATEETATARGAGLLSRSGRKPSSLATAPKK